MTDTPTNPTDRTVDEIVSSILNQVGEWEANDAIGDREGHIIDATQEELTGIDTVDEHYEFYTHVKEQAMQNDV